MSKGGASDWRQLPELLKGLTKAKMTPRYEVMGKIARKAIEADQFGIILQCLHQASKTEMRLSKIEVLYNVIYGLRAMAMNDRWSEKATAKAIRDANEVAMLLEEEEHGGGKVLRPADPRVRPYILAVYLELAAVYAFKYQDGKDVDGKVKAYAERLMFNMKNIPGQTAWEVKQLAAAEKMAEQAEVEAKEEYEAAEAASLDKRTVDAQRLKKAKEKLQFAQEARMAAQEARIWEPISKEEIEAKAGMRVRPFVLLIRCCLPFPSGLLLTHLSNSPAPRSPVPRDLNTTSSMAPSSSTPFA